MQRIKRAFALLATMSAVAFAGPVSSAHAQDKPTVPPGAVLRSEALFRSDAASGQTGPRSVSVAAASTGPVNLYNVVTGQCADLPGYGNGTINGPVNEYPCHYTSSDNQRWYLDWYDSYRFVIRNAKDGYCVDVPNYGPVNAGTLISEYSCRPGNGDNQLYWLSDRTGNGDYWLVNDQSGLCLDVAGVRTGGNDARLTLFYCSDYDDHIWDLVP